MEYIDIQVLKDEILNAIRRCVENQRELLQTGRVERTITHYLAVELRNINIDDIRYFNIDPFYNKLAKDPKSVNREHLGGRRGNIESDILIHKRFTHNYNLLVIEIETVNGKAKKDDLDKLKEMTRPNGDYRYKLGLFVQFGIKSKAGAILKASWFEDGEELSIEWQYL